MQLDAEEDGEPFFKPQQQTGAPPVSGKQKELEDGEEQDVDQRPPQTGEDEQRGEAAQAAADRSTVEQEE